MEGKPRLSLCNREKMKQRNVTRFSNSTQETSYNYSDTMLPFKKNEDKIGRVQGGMAVDKRRIALKEESWA